jgi:hypothetical protein
MHAKVRNLLEAFNMTLTRATYTYVWARNEIVEGGGGVRNKQYISIKTYTWSGNFNTRWKLYVSFFIIMIAVCSWLTQVRFMRIHRYTYILGCFSFIQLRHFSFYSHKYWMYRVFVLWYTGIWYVIFHFTYVNVMFCIDIYMSKGYFIIVWRCAPSRKIMTSELVPLLLALTSEHIM